MHFNKMSSTTNTATYSTDASPRTVEQRWDDRAKV
jgi:hypothetical protein